MPHEVYLSTDVEADGPIPGPHSMLSFASAAFRADGTMIGTFSRHLTLPGAEGHPENMSWWRDHVVVWEASRLDVVDPEAALREYVTWIDARRGSRCSSPIPPVSISCSSTGI